jgi:MFS family permease
MVVPLQMGGFMLAANWFIKFRGRVMGIITAGSPLFSVVGISVLTYTVTVAGGIKPAYIIIGVIIMIFDVLLALLLKDNPEDAGIFADGVDQPTADVNEEETMTLKEVLSESKAWKLIISYGIYQFVINAMMASMAIRYFMLSDNPENPAATWLKALFYLSIGAIAGIPMSFILGWIDDKLGSIKASLVLNVLFFFAVIPLWVMPVGGSVPLMLTWAFGVACMTGGVPTMHPCVTAYVYCRKKYQAANKWIMTIQAIPFAFSVLYMTKLFDMGLVNVAYGGLVVMLVIAFIVVLTMRNNPDANAADRAYKKK